MDLKKIMDQIIQEYRKNTIKYPDDFLLCCETYDIPYDCTRSLEIFAIDKLLDDIRCKKITGVSDSDIRGLKESLNRLFDTLLV
jgi:hypothetical protein